MQLAGRFEWRKWRQITEDAGASFGLSPSRVVVLENHAFSTVHTALHVFLRLCGSVNRLGADVVVIQYVYTTSQTKNGTGRTLAACTHIVVGQGAKVRSKTEGLKVMPHLCFVLLPYSL